MHGGPWCRFLHVGQVCSARQWLDLQSKIMGLLTRIHQHHCGSTQSYLDPCPGEDGAQMGILSASTDYPTLSLAIHVHDHLKKHCGYGIS